METKDRLLSVCSSFYNLKCPLSSTDGYRSRRWVCDDMFYLGIDEKRLVLQLGSSGPRYRLEPGSIDSLILDPGSIYSLIKTGSWLGAFKHSYWVQGAFTHSYWMWTDHFGNTSSSTEQLGVTNNPFALTS